MKFAEHRQMTELSFMGSCILEDRHKHFTFLSAKNFHKWGEFDLPFIWDCLPGDILQVATNARKRGRDIAYTIASVTNYTVYSDDVLKRIALGLMEDDYREGFIIILSRLGVTASTPVLRAAFSEVLADCSDYSIDVYQLIDSGIEYLNKFADKGVNFQLEKFQERIIQKNKDIKELYDRF